MRKKEATLTLVLVEAVVALTSIVYGIGLAVGAIHLPLAFLEGAPFSDYTLPGLVMAIIVGGSALLAAVTLLAGHTAGVFMSALAGLILLGFEVVEVTTIDPNAGDWLPLVVMAQSVYSVLGLTMVGLAAYLWAPTHAERPLRVRRGD